MLHNEATFHATGIYDFSNFPDPKFWEKYDVATGFLYKKLPI